MSFILSQALMIAVLHPSLSALVHLLPKPHIPLCADALYSRPIWSKFTETVGYIVKNKNMQPIGLLTLVP